MFANISNVMMASYPISEWEVPFNWEWLVRNSFKTIFFSRKLNYFCSTSMIKILTKSCMKMREIGLRGGEHPLYPLDPPMLSVQFFHFHAVFWQKLCQIIGLYPTIWEILDPPLDVDLPLFDELLYQFQIQVFLKGIASAWPGKDIEAFSCVHLPFFSFFSFFPCCRDIYWYQWNVW